MADANFMQSAGASTGLAQELAQARLRDEGPNELPRAPARSVWRVVVDVFREPMFRLLLGAGAIYLVLGDLREALLLLVFATLSVAITVVQQTRTERALEALRDLSSPRALVIRDGRQQRIAGRDVVREDLILLSEGDRVPADAVLLSATDLTADESILTGESVPVGKRAARAGEPAAPPGGDDLPFVFSGSLIVRGHAVAQVRATGARSEIGRIGAMLREIAPETTPLSLQLKRLVRWFAAAGLATSAAVFVIYGITEGAWLQGLLAGIALAMALLPEEFPLVMTVFLALGARRIAQRNVLARRAASVEALGAATVLCVDKTGTLTLNRMSVAELRSGESAQRLAPHDVLASPLAELVRIAAMACASAAVDPMEQALLERGRALLPRAVPVREYALTPELLAMSNVWPAQPERSDAAGDLQAPCLVAAKGAPEAIAQLCGLDATQHALMRHHVEAMAARGVRVIGVARAQFHGTEWPDTQRGFSFAYVGLIGFADPLRPSVPAAIEQCRAAGVRVIMVTGDYPATARAIARQAGLLADADVLSGAEIDRLDEAALQQRLRETAVCARVMPRHKLRIVEALKADGEVVAMTGDGVNDAPSLRAAHIGIAMGGRGTDVAREAASLVLLDDDFGSIVEAIALGRRVYDNIRKAMAYILAVHVPIAGLALLPMLVGWPIVIGPVHIAFLEFVIDPVCSVVFEAEPAEADVMRRAPRPPAQPVFSRGLIPWSLLQGALALLVVVALHVALRFGGVVDEDVRLVTFVTVVLTNVALIFVNRTFGGSLDGALRRPNASLRIMLVVLTIVLALVLGLPWFRHVFGFGTVHWSYLMASVAVSAALALVLEWMKRWWSPLASAQGGA